MHSKNRLAATLALGLGFATLHAGAAELTPVTVITTWYAQAEHGGLYAAKAMGIYEEHGLDVNIRMGGPQVNNVQLLMGGKSDFSMGYALQSLNAVHQDIPLVTVAAFFQKDPQSLVAHAGVGNDSLGDLKGKGLRIPTAGRVAYWPWLKAEYGFTDDQLRPYDYTFGPFIADRQAVQQGYVTNDSYFLAKEGIEAHSLLLADYGWNAYAATLDTTQKMLDADPELVQNMVAATAKGWAAYFDDPAAANALIKQDNPEMADDLLAYSKDKMQEEGMLLSGDAAEGQYGIMTRERWERFFQDMVKAGTLPADLDWEKAFDLRFVDTLYSRE